MTAIAHAIREDKPSGEDDQDIEEALIEEADGQGDTFL